MLTSKLIYEFEIYLKDKLKFKENTVKSYINDVNCFLDFYNKDLKNISKIDIIDFIINLQKNNLSNNTIRRYISSLRKFFGYLLDHNYITIDPMKDLNPPEYKISKLIVISQKDIQKLLNLQLDSNIIGLRDMAILEMLYTCGVRVSELINIELQDLNRDYIALNNRKVFINFKLSVKIKNYLKIREGKSKYLFLSKNNSKMTRQSVWSLVKNYGRELGIINLSPKVIRDSLVVHLIENGASLSLVKEYLDISNMSFYQDYYKDRYKKTDIKNFHPRF